MTDIFRAPPKYWGWRFHYTLTSLKRAYESALEAQAKLDKQYDSFHEAQKRGHDPDEDERDWEDHIRAWDEHLSDEWHEAETVKRLVLEAFIIALHHLWERQVKAATGQPYDPGKAFGWLKKHGLKPQERALTELKYTAETLKHSDGTAAEKLYRLRKTLFDPTFAPQPEDADYESIRVKAEDFNVFWDAVLASGPQDRRMGF